MRNGTGESRRDIWAIAWAMGAPGVDIDTVRPRIEDMYLVF